MHIRLFSFTPLIQKLLQLPSAKKKKDHPCKQPHLVARVD